LKEHISIDNDEREMPHDMEVCPECGGQIGARPTADGVLEDVCLKCGNVGVKRPRIKETLDRPGFRRPKWKKGAPKGSEDLLDEKDPSWRYLIPEHLTDKDPNPVLSSLFRNPYVGIWDYKDRTMPSRRSFKTAFHEVYCFDKRRTDKYSLHCHLRMLLDKAYTRFIYSSRGSLKKRKGLFAACLYVEVMLQCFKDIENRTAVLAPSVKAKEQIKQRLVIPGEMKRWASCFHVSNKTVLKRIREIRKETPAIGRTIDFVKDF